MKKQTVLFCISAVGLCAESWVASTGNDTNACTRSAPCKTFQHAHDVTAAGSAIYAADAADYGPVNISKAMTIDGQNVASIGTTSTIPIYVGAGVSDVVQIRNLSVHGKGAQNGISYYSGAHLVLENVKISDFTDQCIIASLSNGSASDLIIKDSTIDNCPVGIFIEGTVTSEISNTNLSFVNTGFEAFGGKHRISNSTFTGSTSGAFAGIVPEPPNLAQITVDNCEISGFGTGVLAYAGTVGISRSNISYNATGVYWQASAILITYGNNTFFGNTTDGTFNKTLTVH
jgi:hypothetical protein